MNDFYTPLRWILVLGMHRSGTSAMTRALTSMGVSLGGNLMEPVEGVNPKGFWEDMDIYRLNDEMLHHLGTNWYHSTPLSDAQIQRLWEQGYGERASAILPSKARPDRPFACKDPRLCRLLSFWQGVLARQDGSTGYVLALRNPVSIADSLQKRDGLERAQSYLLWVAHTLPTLMRTEGAPRVLVDYDLLLEDPRGQVQRMAQALGLSINGEELQRYAEEFLEKGLRHSEYTLKNVGQDASCPPWIASLYRALRQVARDAKALDDPTLQRRLEGTWKQLLRLGWATSAMDRLSDRNMGKA